jgi:predicted nucleic acid-binding protein
VDSSVVVGALIGQSRADCLEFFDSAHHAGEPLAAPQLLWSESTSVLHEYLWRGDIPRPLAERALTALHLLPLQPRQPTDLHLHAWRIAEQMGWARTYDAEFCALAEILDCRLVTIDDRLAQGAEGRLDYVLTLPRATAELRRK